MTGPESLLPAGWPRPSGYAEGIATRGRVVFVSGQIGWDPSTREMVSDAFAAQARRSLENIIAILKTGGARPEHVARMTWYITSRDVYLEARKELGGIWRELFGSHYPAMSVVVVAALLEDRARVEIEATAVVPEE